MGDKIKKNPQYALGRMDSKIKHAIEDLTRLALKTDDHFIKGYLYRVVEDLKRGIKGLTLLII